MEKALVLCDTDVLIELIDRNNQKTFEKVSFLGVNNLCVSSVSYSELIYGSLNKAHQRKLLNELNKFIILSINEDIDNAHRSLLIKYGLSHKLHIQDALIAATAIFYEIPLYSLNISDYKFIEGLRLLK